MKANYIKPSCEVNITDSYPLLSGSTTSLFTDPVIVPREEETD